MTVRSESELYDAVAQALASLSSDVAAAESHGMLCGMLCNPDPFSADAWLRHVLGYEAGRSLAELPATNPLHTMVSATVRSLRDEDFAFALLLPADDAPLDERADALGAWCRGFLSGFGLHGAGANLHQEGREYLLDLYKIGQVAAEDTQGEEGERALLEIAEYARMGAMMLHEEFRSLFTDELPSLH